MKKKINQAVTRKLDKSFDKKFWNKFDSEFSKETEQNWQRLFAPIAMACALIILTVNLYSNDGDYSKKELADFAIEMNEIELLIDSASSDLEGEYYALTD